MSNQSCPLCQQQNECTADSHCWCHSVEVPAAALAAVPEALKNEQCICARCIAKYRNSPFHDASQPDTP